MNLTLTFLTIEPIFFYRHAKMEPVRWMQRRRTYLENPYFSAPSMWKNTYDKKFHVVATD
mgnify:CR=1 FL=1